VHRVSLLPALVRITVRVRAPTEAIGGVNHASRVTATRPPHEHLLPEHGAIEAVSPMPRHLLRVGPRAGRGQPPAGWPFDIPAVAQLLARGWEVPAGVTVLVGENGSGKSTIVEAVAGRYPRLGNDLVGPTVVGDESPLGSWISLQTAPMASRAGFFLRAEAMHSYLSERDRRTGRTERSWDGRPLLDRSHGESFLAVLRERFTDVGMYFLDEPESALSFASCLGLVSLLDTLRAEGSQVIVATHSPLIAALPGATLIELGDWGWRETGWQELEMVQRWRGFLREPEGFLRHLLD
jgi:predicted ATPase